MNLTLDRGGGVRLRTQWLQTVDVSKGQKESSMLLLSLYIGKMMGTGKEVEELKVRVSGSHGMLETRLLGKTEKGWVVGEGVVVVINSLEERVSLEVVDVDRDKVLGEVKVDVAKDNIALVKRQWGERAQVSSSCNVFLKTKRSSPNQSPGICGTVP